MPELHTKGDSAIEVGYEQPGNQYLYIVNGSAKEWLTFDRTINESPVHIFVDLGASYRYMAMRVVNRLCLPMSETQRSVSLEGGRKLPLYRIAYVRQSSRSFQEYTEFYVLDMENNMILGKDFWIKYKAKPGYDSYGLQIEHNSKTFILSGIRDKLYIWTLELRDSDIPLTLLNATQFK